MFLVVEKIIIKNLFYYNSKYMTKDDVEETLIQLKNRFKNYHKISYFYDL